MDNQKNRMTEDILGSLDGSQRALAPEFFYTRLKGRMQREFHKDVRSGILRPAYILAGLALLLIVNTFVILQKNEENVNSTAADNETVQTAAEYYSLNDNTIYDITQEK